MPVQGRGMWDNVGVVLCCRVDTPELWAAQCGCGCGWCAQ